MRVVKLRLDHPNDDPRSSSIIEEVLYELILKAPQRTKDYLRVVQVECGSDGANPIGEDYFGAKKVTP
jgi:hypothetical protein